MNMCKKILKITSFLFLFGLLSGLGGGGGTITIEPTKVITLKSTPEPAIATPSATVQFTAEGGSGNYDYTIMTFFYLQKDVGSINTSSGLYTAPAKIDNEFVIRIQAKDQVKNGDGTERIVTKDLLLQKGAAAAVCN